MTDKNFCPQCGKEIIFKKHHKYYGTPKFCSSGCSATYTFKDKKRSEENCINSSIGAKKRYEDTNERKKSSEIAKNRVMKYPHTKFQKGYEPWNKNLTKNEDSRLQILGNNSGKSRIGKKHLTPEGLKIILQKTRKTNGRSKIEIIMENELQKRNIEFYSECIILNRYRADFLIEDFLVVECDGDYWHNLPGIQKKDKIRDVNMRKNGFEVLRFWEHEINNNVCECIKKIEKYLI